ncbi:MAG: hypothetical protein HON90_03595 [Halobacteriovoraceae bacterium]|jgi:prepilin peptidase CpaA|nr:hypothetical protein [Halobacteriovoraceae bacterium]
MISLDIYLFILVELCFVAYIDIKHRKIKNIWSIVNFLVAVLLFTTRSEIYPFQLDSFLFTFACVAAGFLLFLLKIMGGGDSKYLASFFLLIPLSLQDEVFYYLLIITIIIGLFMLLKNSISNYEKIIQSFKEKDIQGVKSCFGTKFAYAPVILVTWIWIGWDIFIN